jgi:putative membrane protein
MIRPLLYGAAALALTLSACQRQAENEPAEGPGQTAPVNAAQDAASAAVGAVSAATLGQTTEGFVTNAAISDMYEIEAGKLAQEKGQAAGVKEFGAMMVKDHTASSTEMKPLAQAANVTLPTAADERRKGLIDNLRAASGADFDRAYMDQQVAAHEEALRLLNGYAQDGENAGLKAFAAKTAPIVQGHLDKARGLQTAAAQAPAAK